MKMETNRDKEIALEILKSIIEVNLSPRKGELKSKHFDWLTVHRYISMCLDEIID